MKQRKVLRISFGFFYENSSFLRFSSKLFSFAIQRNSKTHAKQCDKVFFTSLRFSYKSKFVLGWNENKKSVDHLQGQSLSFHFYFVFQLLIKMMQLTSEWRNDKKTRSKSRADCVIHSIDLCGWAKKDFRVPLSNYRFINLWPNFKWVSCFFFSLHRRFKLMDANCGRWASRLIFFLFLSKLLKIKFSFAFVHFNFFGFFLSDKFCCFTNFT